MSCFDVYVIKLTEEKISEILEKTVPLGWTLTYLKDNMEFNAEDGFETLLFMKLYKDTLEIATFADEEEDTEQPSVRLTEETDPKFGIFHKFESLLEY